MFIHMGASFEWKLKLLLVIVIFFTKDLFLEQLCGGAEPVKKE